MHCLQHTSRILSGAGCSTSGNLAPSHASPSPRLLLRTDPSTTSSQCCCLQGHTSTCWFQHAKSSPQRRKAKRRSPIHATPLAITADSSNSIPTESIITTVYVAETCLPTKSGKYRVRAYRHSVSKKGSARLLNEQAQAVQIQQNNVWLQIDAGRTFTEPTCIMTGKPEGKGNVSQMHGTFVDECLAC